MPVIVVMKGDAHPRDITRLWKHTRVINRQKTRANGMEATAYTITGFKSRRFRGSLMESAAEEAERYVKAMETDERVLVAFPTYG